MLKTGTISNTKVSNMMSKCDPEGIPKSDKNRFQVMSVFGGTLVRAFPSPRRSWVPTGTGGPRCMPKGIQNGWKCSCHRTFPGSFPHPPSLMVPPPATTPHTSPKPLPPTQCSGTAPCLVFMSFARPVAGSKEWDWSPPHYIHHASLLINSNNNDAHIHV